MRRMSIFDRIDVFFDNQPNKLIYTATMVVCVLFSAYLVQDYTYADSEEYLSNKELEYGKVEGELSKFTDFINSGNTDARVDSMRKELVAYEEKKKEVDKDNGYFTNKLQEISNLLYNQKTWSEFISKINNEANKYGIKLSNISSNINDFDTQKVEEIFNITFKANGRFQNILYFINSLENSKDIVDIAALKIYTGLDKLNNANDSINHESYYDRGDYRDANEYSSMNNMPLNMDHNKRSMEKNKDLTINSANSKDLSLDIKILVWGIKY